MNKRRKVFAFYLVRVLTPIDFYPASFMTAFHVTFLTSIAPYSYSMFCHADHGYIYEGAFFPPKNFSLKQNNYNSCTECMYG